MGTNQPYRKLREFKSSNIEQVQVQPMINKEETKPEPELKSQIKAPPKGRYVELAVQDGSANKEIKWQMFYQKNLYDYEPI